MKRCNYCNREYEDSLKNCPSCGSADAMHICANCGAAFSTKFCPNCGVKAGAKSKRCPDCGREYFSAACPDCGHREDRGADSAAKPSRVTIGTVLLWIFFLPFMAVITIWKSDKLRRPAKILLTLLVAVVYLSPTILESIDKAANRYAAPVYSESQIAQPEPLPGEALAAEFETSFPEGVYPVGDALPAGEYVALATDGFGYFCVGKDEALSDVAFNEIFETNSVLAVENGEYLELSGCIAVPAEDFYATHSIDPSLNGVMLKIGHDLPAGTYKLRATEDSGYYCVYNDLRHYYIVENDLFDRASSVTVTEGQYLILSRCRIEN